MAAGSDMVFTAFTHWPQLLAAAAAALFADMTQKSSYPKLGV
jgi:hypothetical protein